MQRPLQRRRANVIRNYIRRKEATNNGKGKERITQFVINKTNDNLIIKIEDRDLEFKENWIRRGNIKSYKGMIGI